MQFYLQLFEVGLLSLSSFYSPFYRSGNRGKFLYLLGAGFVWRNGVGEVLCNTAVLFERFMFCFPYKRMIKSCDMIVLGVIKKQNKEAIPLAQKSQNHQTLDLLNDILALWLNTYSY